MPSTARARWTLLAPTCCVALILLSGCSGGRDGGLPNSMPNLEGDAVSDAVEELQDKGFTDILLFDAENHAVDPWDGLFADDEEVTLTFPERGDDSVEPVLLWIGERPEVPSNVPQDSWYYPHGERIAQRGTDSCLTCHDREFCGVCHEERLEATDELLSADPVEAPGLLGAVEAVSGSTDVTAQNHGSGWYQVEIVLDSADPRSAATTAREVSVQLFPAGFESESEAETLVIRWVSRSGDLLAEIGYSRENFKQHDWSDMDPLYIAWTADRYAVPSW